MTAICTALYYCLSAQVKPENLHMKTPSVFVMGTCKKNDMPGPYKSNLHIQMLYR